MPPLVLQPLAINGKEEKKTSLWAFSFQWPLSAAIRKTYLLRWMSAGVTAVALSQSNCQSDSVSLLTLHKHTQPHTHTHSHPATHTHTATRPHTHTQPHTHTHTHTHTHVSTIKRQSDSRMVYKGQMRSLSLLSLIHI